MLGWLILLTLLGVTHNYSMTSAAMAPTIPVGSVVIANQAAWPQSGAQQNPVTKVLAGFLGDAPRRGDLAVFRGPRSDEILLSRIVGLPGDTVQMRAGRLVVNGEQHEREKLGEQTDINSIGHSAEVVLYRETNGEGVSYAIFEVGDDEFLDNTAEYVVPADHYFMMGDNRDRSADSRIASELGMVSAADLAGEIVMFHPILGSQHGPILNP